jgi:hypothetical protein
MIREYTWPIIHRMEHSDTALIRQSGLSTTLACTGKTKIRPECILRLLG